MPSQLAFPLLPSQDALAFAFALGQPLRASLSNTSLANGTLCADMPLFVAFVSPTATFAALAATLAHVDVALRSPASSALRSSSSGSASAGLAS